VAIKQATYAGVRDDLNPNNEFIELTFDTRFNSGTPPETSPGIGSRTAPARRARCPRAS